MRSWKRTTCSTSFLMKSSYSTSEISFLLSFARAVRISLVCYTTKVIKRPSNS